MYKLSQEPEVYLDDSGEDLGSAGWEAGAEE